MIAEYVPAALRVVDGRVLGRAELLPHLRAARGGVHSGTVLTLLDYAGGLCAGVAAGADAGVVSTNLTARIVQRDCAGPLRVESQVARRGRNSVVTPVRVRDEGAHGALVADAVLTSAILASPGGTPRWDRPLTSEEPADQPPWEQWLGTRAVDDHTVELDLAEKLRNPWGILHGGVVTALVDLATEHATGTPAADVVIHFLAPNRAGPVRAAARRLGTRSDGTVCRVEVRDEGAGRLTVVAVTTARA
jgi:uncharacterized protein (TIGR00369 family)